MTPQSAFIVLTTECDKRDECGYCFYNVQPERLAPERLTTAQIISFLKKIALLNVSTVFLTGGEPTLRDDLEDIIQSASKMQMNVNLLTNGRGIDPARVEILEEAGLSHLILSISSLSEIDVETAMKFSALQDTSLSFIFVVTAENYKLVPDMIELASRLEAGVLFQPAFVPSESEVFSSLSPSRIDPFEWSWLYSRLAPWAAASGLRGWLSLFHGFYGPKKQRPARCEMGRSSFVVDADGEVYACFHRRDISCGSILTREPSEIFAALEVHSRKIASAPCFGEHCLSLHTSFKSV